MRALLISTYDLGRQPFGLASPAAWLRRDGAEVVLVDIAKDRLDPDVVASANLVAFHLPMHTATRLAAPVIRSVRALNPAARICAYGVYAPLNKDSLRELGVDDVLGGEFEEDPAGIAKRVRDRSTFARRTPNDERRTAAIPRLQFLVPDRSDLPPLSRYATLQLGDGTRRIVGYTEASR